MRRWHISTVLVAWFMGSFVVPVSDIVSAAAKPVPVTVYEIRLADQIEKAKVAYKAFEDAVGIPAKPIVVDWSERETKMMSMIAGGVAPDVTNWGTYLFARGIFEPLDSYIAKGALDISWCNPGHLKLFQYNGVQYGIPSSRNTYVTVYNVDMFEQAGLARPPTNWNADDWTYEGRFLSDAKKLTVDKNGDGRPDQWGLWGYLGYTWTLPYRWETSWFSKDLRTFNAHDETLINSLQFAADLVTRWHVQPTWSEFEAMGADDPFASGKVAMQVTGTWGLRLYRDIRQRAGLDWNIAALPHGRGHRPWTIYYGNGWMVFKDSQNKDAALKFVKYVTGPEGQELYNYNAMGELPAHPQAQEWLVRQLAQDYPGLNVRVLLEAFNYAGLSEDQWVPLASQVDSILMPALGALWDGRKNAQQVLAEVEGPINRILRSTSK